MIDFANMATHLLVTGSLLAILALAFALLFLIPGCLHWFRLRTILVGILDFQGKTPPGEFKKLFAQDQRLAHLWREYQDSLHVQREEREGQMQVIAIRSTVPAEAYFNSQYVVDSRLRTEFFKHLPGIFTGLGIIGTFTGLIEGLRRFQVSENAATVRTSLESLMHSVGEAFLISAAAIGAAMFVTFVEKFLLAALYSKSEGIAHAIDARFEAGAGEEYLSRLVLASEDSASQSKILKDALVSELGDLLRELTAAQLATGEKLNQQLVKRIEDTSSTQVAAAREDNKALGDVIAGSIERSLKEPLETIASTVKTVTGDQSASAVQMLNDVMVSFSQRLNDLFGGQINGINELNKQTAQSMQEAVNSLNALVGKMEETAKRSSHEMAAQMSASSKAMEDRQGSINAQTQDHVDKLHKLVESSQAETQQKLQAALASVGQQMTGILGALGESQSKVFEANRVREETMADRANGMVSHMMNGVGELHKQTSQGMQDAVKSLNALVGKMEETGKRSSDDMAAQMVASLKGMEEQQRNINDQTQAFVDQIRQLVASSQGETQQKLHAMLQAMGQQMAGILSALNKVQTKAFEDQRVREEDSSNRTKELVSSMAGSVETAAKEMAAASQIMAQSVSTLTDSTNLSVAKMNIGAERLGTAATSFATAGDKVTGVMSQAASVSSKLTEVSGSLTTSAGAVEDALRDYRAQREAVSLLLTEVRATVDLARREASLTADVLQRIEASTAKLGTAQQAADIYLDGVSQVLADSSEAFRESVVSTLSKVNHDFHTKLSHAVGLLSNSVQELEVTLGSVAPRR